MDDEFELMKFIALGWQKYFNENPLIKVNSKFPKELEKYLKEKPKDPDIEETDDDTDTGGEGGNGDDGAPTDTEASEPFKPIDDNSFEYDGEVYQILI